jgi:predicted dehydrogenase
MVEGKMMKVETDDNAHICIEFANNCYAVITTGFTIQKYRVPAIEIYGSEGTIQMMGDDWDPEGYELWQNKEGAWKVFEETHPNWPWTDGINHLVECIREGKKPIVTPEQAYHVIEIMEAARAAGKDGQRREIQSTFTPASFFTEEEEQEALHLRHDRTN